MRSAFNYSSKNIFLNAYSSLKDTARRAKFDLSSLSYIPSSNPIFILGNQKAGTSIITYLLAELTHCSATIDLQREISWPTFHQIQGDADFRRFTFRNRKCFSRDIIKEPNLSLFYPYLKRLYPRSKFVFIVREPRDNIRSMLNRLRLPGDMSILETSAISNISQAWQLVIDTRWYNGQSNYTIPSGNYIELLAHRWNVIADIFLHNCGDIVLVRYEDFLKNKVGSIEQLARKLELGSIEDIADKTNTQLQIKGNKETDLTVFFGDKNIKAITHICAEYMAALGYEL